MKEHFPQFISSEYLAWEKQQEFRHEFVDGEIYAMTGGSVNHSEIGTNFSTVLKNHLRGSGCRVLNSDAKVQIMASNSFC